MTYTVLCGDVSEVLPTLAPESFDAVLCDPPYGLSFMGKHWDHGVPGEPTWRMVAAALKPGAHLMAFGGTRTFHRLACAIEDAGFEIRDCLSWLYGQGFPKSLDISKAIDKAAGAEREVKPWRDAPGAGIGMSLNVQCPECEKWMRSPDPCRCPRDNGAQTTAARTWQGYGTALKPAWEPCILAMKPTDGTFAANAMAHGVAGLNVDGGRIPAADEIAPVTGKGTLGGTGDGWDRPWKRDTAALAARQERANEAIAKANTLGRWPANVLLDEAAANLIGEPSRFFYTAKASRGEREAGLEGMPAPGGTVRNDGGAQHTQNVRLARNHHPTLKPLALCEYLARLILPPKRDTPRRLLVPFSGSGSEMIGALLAGWDEVVGIEREAEYVAIAEARLAHWTKSKRTEEDGAQMELIA